MKCYELSVLIDLSALQHSLARLLSSLLVSYRWLELVLEEELPSDVKLEDALQNGVYLCRLGMVLLPNDEMWKKVYDLDQSKFKVGVSSGQNAASYQNSRSLIQNPGLEWLASQPLKSERFKGQREIIFQSECVGELLI